MEFFESFDSYQEAWRNRQRAEEWLDYYRFRRLSFVPNLLPEQALAMPAEEVIGILRARFGKAIDLALSETWTSPEPFEPLPPELMSPVQSFPDSDWLKRTRMVGVNIRTIGNFFNLVKYCLTLPDFYDSIHILPVWEPGVVASIYGMSSWQINREFYSMELAELFPWLNRVERQLKAVIHLLHVMGRAVGMDVIPHTDRFSEMALAFPEYFEWMQRRGLEIVDHSTGLIHRVQACIWKFVQDHGSAVEGLAIPESAEEFFSPHTGEKERNLILFGLPEDFWGRLNRRMAIIQELYARGFETVPATMAPPFRGIEVDPSPEAEVVDEFGMVWRDFRMIRPTPMSRVFNPLARYRLYERKENGEDWELDFNQPVKPVWEYVCSHYAEVQRCFGFDFMRGDMSHVQMRPEGVPDQVDDYYDLLGAVKETIRQRNHVPFFGYFAESFLPPRDVMGYGEEMDHLEASHADVTLGDLQSTCMGTAEFLQRFRYYDDLLRTRKCAPSFTVMTSDKDDPRFDRFYLDGNEARAFLSLFLTDMPSYVALGFETRDPHPEPAPNEYYTKLYVFQEKRGNKVTQGAYRWGRNAQLFANLQRIRLFYERIREDIADSTTRWLIPPDATGMNPVVAWTQMDIHPAFVFVVNTCPHCKAGRFGLPLSPAFRLRLCFALPASSDEELVYNGVHFVVPGLMPGEVRAYQVETHREG